MVLPKSKKAVGLGNSLMNDRFGKGKGADMRRGNFQTGIQRRGVGGETYITNEKKQASWVKLRSVTEQASLDEFLNTADLAGTDFAAEKLNNMKIIHNDQKNPYLLSVAEERTALRKHNANRKRLTIPRRPLWDGNTTPQELDERERESFLEWRRGLAELQESHDLLMTPFERNLEVWRQLWRVIERSDLVVQIVDARNPLLFRCEDLERYVKEVDPEKNNLLLVNKADMMTLKQRRAWADYFVSAGISFRFFSAELAREMNEARAIWDKDTNLENAVNAVDEGHIVEASRGVSVQDARDDKWTSKEESDNQETGVSPSDDERTRILTTDELEDLFVKHAPKVDIVPDKPPRKTTIGLVGYPNVGKSSTINALIGTKKVSVSATPGKTKHFQTIHLSDSVILCDCPGLVFPNFATTKAELVCSGVLPIDQLREFTGPAGLVAQRIPQPFLEAIYGMKIYTRPIEEGGTGIPTSEEILSAYAIARGFATTGQGQPDESRAARYILKDYVKGKLLCCHPPPTDPPIDLTQFNRELYDEAHLLLKRRATYVVNAEAPVGGPGNPPLADDLAIIPMPPVQSEKSRDLDEKFFARGQGNSGHLNMPFHYKYSEQGLASRKPMGGREQKTMITLEKDIDPADLQLRTKKHFKANKRKVRKSPSGYGI